MAEEIIVKLDQGPVAPVVPRECFPAGFQRKRIPAAINQPEELLCLAAPPAVNGLFGISHKDQGSLFSLIVLALKRVPDKRDQVRPLHFRGILELIYEIMAVTLPKPFIDIRGRLVFQFP